MSLFGNGRGLAAGGGVIGGGGGTPAPATPDITSATLTPSSGSFAGGVEVVVTGATGIESGHTLTLGGVATPIRVISATSFAFVPGRIAVASAGAKALVITNTAAQSSTKASAYTYLAAGVVPQFSSMVSLDAGIPDVGQVAELVGATTGAVVLRCRRVAAGAGGLAIEGPILLWQATGTEFDGAFAWQSLGSAGAVTWGTPGAEATGGLIPPVGTVRMGGFRDISGRHGHVRAAVYIEALPGAPVADNCLLVGQARPAATTMFGGGISRATSDWRSGCVSGGAVDAPGNTETTPALTPPTGQISWLTWYRMKTGNLTNYGSANGGFENVNNSGAWAGAGANNSNMGTSSDDYAPCITRVGDWTARITRLICDWGGVA